MQVKLSSYLENLEKDYQLVNCLRPLLSMSDNTVKAYEISDQFLRFWFRFIGPYRSYIEQGQLSLVREKIEEDYDSFTGRTLEQYFRVMTKETGRYTQVGCWWSNKGRHEIDLIALNEKDHTGLVAEIKRNRQRIRLAKLRAKVKVLPRERFGEYTFTLRALSIDDMKGLRIGIWNRWLNTVARFLHRLFGC